MRYLGIELQNYIGIYNGMKINKISIDFTRCKHKLLVIKGDNGSGKSTLFNAISILPDDNSCFIPGKEARKIVSIYDDHNHAEYQVVFIHGIKKTGERDTTKGYISKKTEEGFIEMNPNGNISSYKDYVYAEFQLDANFLALSQLSSEDRGLVEKRPAERKKFVNSIINTLEVYNAMYKTLSKKSSVYKSMINSIIAKINTLGDPAMLQGHLSSIENRIDSMKTKRQEISNRISDNRSMIKILDPNGDIQGEYDDIYSSVSLYDDTKAKILKDIKKYGFTGEYSELRSVYENNSRDITILETTISNNQSNINSLLVEQDEKYKALNLKIEKLRSVSSVNDRAYYEDAISNLKTIVSEQEYVLSQLGLLNNPITRDEFISALNALNDIREEILALKDSYSYDVLNQAVNYIYEGCYPPIDIYTSQYNQLSIDIDNSTKRLAYLSGLQQVVSRLNIRPANCSITDCSYISDALSTRQEYPNLEQDIMDLQYEIDTKTTMINRLSEVKQRNQLVAMAISAISSVMKRIASFNSILRKIPNGAVYSHREHVLKRLLENDSFQDIRELYNHIDLANVLEEHRINLSTLEKLSNEYQAYLSREDIVLEIKSSIDEMNNSLKTIADKISSNREELSKSMDTINKARVLDGKLSSLISLYDNLNELEAKSKEKVDRFNKISASITRIKELSNQVTKDLLFLSDIDEQIKPLETERDNINHSMRMIDEYNKELKDYRTNYDKIETVKYYTSPSTGIQTIFMELYMHNILSMANDLLSRVFNGEFSLQPFIINETEFRIPCMGEGLLNDDISSMSTSQKCMISMILSFSLLVHSSSRYNILKIDEIDGGLDTQNRLNFISLLDYLMNYIGCQQCIMISHNNEVDLSQADVIVLKDKAGEFNQGNIIFKY